MKIKRLNHIIALLVVIIGLVLVFNIKVTTSQGLNYKVQSIRIPLYLKVLDFFDRHYNYLSLARRITAGSKNQEERAIRLFEWTYNNIRPQPDDLPVVDDHAWNIIVRGYGMDDQHADLFATLCNYVGAESFFGWLKHKNEKKRIVLTFVKIDKAWRVFDPYRGNIVVAEKGKLASVEDIIAGNWKIKCMPASKLSNFDYAPYFCNLEPISEISMKKSKLQSPFNRMIYQVKQLFKVR